MITSVQQPLKSTSDNFSVIHENPDILDYMLYYDGIYLVVKHKSDIHYYKLRDTFNSITIKIGDINVDVYAKEIERQDLPEKARSVVAREII